MASTPSTPWWKSDPTVNRAARAARIANYRDESTSADEILIWTRRILWFSLFFTGALCWVSYEHFLARFTEPIVAIVAATLVTLVIELGKAKLGIYAVRIPFLDGFGAIWRTVESTFMWLGVLVFTVVVFWMSVYNSTKGAERFSLSTSRARTERVFAPNTADLDAQITDAQKRIDTANKNTWKGVVSYESQKAVTAESRTIQKLQGQKEALIAKQREDFERSRSFTDQDNGNTGSMVLAIGGFLELLQIILLIVSGACERVLDRKIAQQPATSSPAPSSTRPATTSAQQFQPIHYQHINGQHSGPQNSIERPRIGFQQAGTPQYAPESVAQPATPVAQIRTTFDPDAILRLSRSSILKDWKNDTNQHANTQSIAKRLINAVNDALKHFDNPDFLPENGQGWSEWMSVVVEMYCRWRAIEPEVFSEDYINTLWVEINKVNARLKAVQIPIENHV